MTETQLCPICKSPRRSSSSGSLTQWIVACNCDRRDAKIPENLEPVSEVCRNCGKTVGKGRDGSFTQFIFRSDVCRCAVPKVLKDALDAAPVAEGLEPVGEDVDEIELPLDNDSFPNDRYKPLAALGTGGGGSVYLARDMVLNKRVAVKMLHMLESKQLVAFQAEARATSKLTHPSIVGVLDFGLTKTEIPYMVLDYFEGTPLDHVLENEGALDWHAVQEIFEQVCDALEYAHANGVYHRDIKPGNLLLQAKENGAIEVRIIDFGIAKIDGESKNNLSAQSTTMVGAPLYMSPDSGLGLRYDRRSEVYSVGCVLFEALTGSPPFRGESALQTLSLHANQKPPRLSEINPDIQLPAGVEALIERALSKNPDDRFQSMADLGQAIQNIDPDSSQIVPGAKTLIKSPLLVSLRNLTMLGLIAIIGFVLVKTTFAPPVTRIEVERENSANLKAEEVRKNREEIEMLKTSDIVKNLNLTGGKWKRNGSLLEGHEVIDDDFKSITDVQDIHSFKLTVESKVTGEGLKYLKGAPLTAVFIMSNLFNDKGVAQLKTFSRLIKLTFQYDNEVSPEAFRDLVNSLPDLARVQLRFMSLKPGMLEALQDAKSLNHVDIGHSTPVTAEALNALTKIKNLNSLVVTNTEIDDRALKIISKARLTNFDIGETKVSDDGLMMIARDMRQLRSIKVTVGDGISSLGIKRFKKMLPSCALLISDGLNPMQLLDYR